MAIDQASEAEASLEFPETPAGRRARWYIGARSGNTLSKTEVQEYFAPSFESGWGSPHDDYVREQWIARWAQFKVKAEKLREISPYEVEIEWRFPGGAKQRNKFQVEEEEPHRILRFDNMPQNDAAPPPSSFAVLTEVTKSGDTYKGQVHQNFVTPMGIFGGYIAAIALRAAGAHTSKPKPLSMSCHFLNPGRMGEVEANVATLRSSSRLESMRVELIQDEKVLLEALVWATTELEGPEHVVGGISDIPRPDQLLNFQELFPGQPRGPFQQAVEGKPLLDGWQPDGDPPWSSDPQSPPRPGDPRLRGWVRLLPAAPVEDEWVAAAKTLVPFDWLSVNATTMPHRGRWIQPPSLDTTIAFYNLNASTEWMFVDSESPIANAGFASATASIWSENGSLIAVAMQQVMHRVINQSALQA